MGQYLPAPEGSPSIGVAPGGLENQILAKASDLNYDTEWVDAPAGTGSGGTGPQGPQGPAGPAGVVAATAPIAYDSGTQTVSTNMATNRLLGRSSAGTGVAEEISVGSGLSLSSGTLSATLGGTDLSYTASSRLLESSTGGDVTLPLFTSALAGLTPLSGGGTTNFLRADGTWAAPPSAFTGGTLTSNLTLAAGTSSLSPLRLQSGANLATATAGAVEYDGSVIYSTPGGRGVSPSMMFYRLDSNLTGASTTADQSLFGVGVTLAASTVYAFELNFAMSKASGTNSHTFGLNFGGTATVNNIFCNGTSNGSNVTPPALILNAASVTITSTANATIGASSTSSVMFRVFRFTGTVSVNAGGTFIPQYRLSVSPGGAYSTVTGSHLAIWPIGAAGANTSVGPWA